MFKCWLVGMFSQAGQAGGRLEDNDWHIFILSVDTIALS
jgi:hypothetical protein